MKSMDAIVLAGEKEGSIPVMGVNKAFLPFQDCPLIGWVIKALDGAESVSSITVVGPRDRLESELGRHPVGKPIKVLDQGRNIFENIWEGALSTFPGYEPGAPASQFESTPLADKTVVALTCDMPLLEPAEVEHFVTTAPLDKADFVFGVTRHEVLEPYEPHDGEPGIKFIYVCFRDRLYRHANVFSFRPLKIAHAMETFIPIIYRVRYQRHLKNVFAAARETIRYAFSPGPLTLFFFLQAASYCHNHGHHRLRQIFRQPLGLEWSERQTSKAVRTKFKSHETIGPGTTLDVDDDDSYRAFIAMADKWKKIQLAQIEKNKSV